MNSSSSGGGIHPSSSSPECGSGGGVNTSIESIGASDDVIKSGRSTPVMECATPNRSNNNNNNNNNTNNSNNNNNNITNVNRNPATTGGVYPRMTSPDSNDVHVASRHSSFGRAPLLDHHSSSLQFGEGGRRGAVDTMYCGGSGGVGGSGGSSSSLRYPTTNFNEWYVCQGSTGGTMGSAFGAGQPLEGQHHLMSAIGVGQSLGGHHRVMSALHQPVIAQY